MENSLFNKTNLMRRGGNAKREPTFVENIFFKSAAFSPVTAGMAGGKPAFGHHFSHGTTFSPAQISSTGWRSLPVSCAGWTNKAGRTRATLAGAITTSRFTTPAGANCNSSPWPKSIPWANN